MTPLKIKRRPRPPRKKTARPPAKAEPISVEDEQTSIPILGLPDDETIRTIAIRALIGVAESSRSSSAARAAAARTLLESQGVIGRLQELGKAQQKPLSEMNAAEIALEIERLEPKSRKR